MLSTGNSFTEIYLDKYNTTLVSGDNGAGKSTILDALTYSLYGKSFRGIKNNSLINSINEKEFLVEVEFSVNKHDYKVKRGIKPKVFEIYKDGSLVPQNATIKDYQNVLEEQILKMSFKAFCQVVLLGSSSYIPFMKLPTKDRKIIVEDLLDISIFSTMNGILKTRVSTNKDKLTIIAGKVGILESKIHGQGVLIDKMEEKSKESIEGFRSEISKTTEQVESLQKEVEGLNSVVEELMSSIGDREKVFNDLERAESVEKKLKNNCKRLMSELLIYDNNNCPTCNQDITEEHRDKMVGPKKDKIKEIEEAIEQVSKNVSSLESTVSKINEVLNRVHSTEIEISDKNGTISACNKYISKMNKNIEDHSNNGEEIESEVKILESLREEHDKFDVKRKELVDSRTELETVSSLLKDTGIKSRIIGYYLPIMNKMINQYLTSMNFFCHFSLDENFDETIRSRYRDEFTYYNFSEGERLRIDLSLLLAWREVARLKNSVNCNLLILDEVFDSSLDSVGTEEFLKILSSLGNKANVFVITHKSDQLMDKFENNLHFKKKGNFSEVTFRMHRDEDQE